jgi:hypothetical protein
MWMVLEQGASYPLDGGVATSYPDFGCMGVRYLPTSLCFSKVVEKKEENVVFNRNWVALSTNPILIH